MSLNTLNHFYDIKVGEPAFTNFYYEHFSKTDIKKYEEEITNTIKLQLRNLLINQGRDLGVAIDVEAMLYKPLVELGLPLNTVVVIIRELASEEVGYLKLYHKGPDLSLTVKGKNWLLDRENVEPGKRQNLGHLESNQGFIASWFDDARDESIKAIEEGISETGYEPMCIKDKHYSEKVMDKALAEIKQSRFIVADLTGGRNSVFFEAGYAFALGLDIIYVYQESEPKTETLEFYVKHYKCSKYSNPKELKEIVKKAISARIVK